MLYVVNCLISDVLIQLFLVVAMVSFLKNNLL